MKQLTFSILALALLSPTALAEEEAERIVISGTRTAKLLSDSPVAVDVIDGHTIGQIAKGTLADALEFIPGVVITRSPKDGYNVMLQGFESQHVLILVDGQPLISPTGAAADLDQVSAQDIAQIEVLRGASSVLYGSSAMGGVINIITNKEGSDHLSLEYQLGSYLENAPEQGDAFSQQGRVWAGKSLWGWQHKANLQWIKDSGFDYNPNTISQDAAEIDKVFVNWSSAKSFETLDAAVKYQYFDEAKSKPVSTIPGQAGIIYYQSDVEQHQFDFNLNGTSGLWQLNTRLSAHDEVSGQTGSQRSAEITLAKVNGQRVWQFGKVNPKKPGEQGGELVAGFETHFDGLDQAKVGEEYSEIHNKTRHSLESYLQYNWISTDYQILAGVRGQEDSNFGFHSAVSVNGMIDLSQPDHSIQLRAGFNQGYRVPNLKERFYLFDHRNLGYMVWGDEDLVPEESNTLNASLNYSTSAWSKHADLSFELSSHFSKTDNLIMSVWDAEATAQYALDNPKQDPTDLDVEIYSYTNIGSADIYGFDFSSQLTCNQWFVQLNYSYLETEDQDGNRLEDRPRHQVKFNLGYDIPGYDIETLLYLVYQADEATPSEFVGTEVDNYTLVNLKFNQALTQQLEWHLALNNLFNEHKSPDAASRGLFDPRPVHSQEIRLGVSYTF